MRAERAVEPTRSENITVTWRRSAVSRGGASPAARMPSAPAPVFGVASRLAIERSNLRRAEQNAELLQVLIREIGQDAVVYCVIAKRGLVLLKAKAPQPARHVHDTTVLTQACAMIDRTWRPVQGEVNFSSSV